MIFIGRIKKNELVVNLDDEIVRGELGTLPERLSETDRQIVIKVPYNLADSQFTLFAENVKKMGFKNKVFLLEGGADIKLL